MIISATGITAIAAIGVILGIRCLVLGARLREATMALINAERVFRQTFDEVMIKMRRERDQRFQKLELDAARMSQPINGRAFLEIWPDDRTHITHEH